MARKKILIMLFLAAVLSSYGFWRFVLDAGHRGPPTISEKVTSVTNPEFVNEDGYVDYLKALNSWRREGIDPDENACVDMYRFFPPEAEDLKEQWVERWEMISDEPLPSGPFFNEKLRSGAYALTDENYEGLERPWLDHEFPDLATWIVENEEPARRLVAAIQKREFYHPCTLSGDDDHLLMILLALTTESRMAARFFNIRAMNHLANDRIDECMSDLVAIRSLGRLIEQKGFLIEHLIGIAIAGIATEGERQMICSGKLDRMQILDYLQRLDELIPYNDLAATYKAERFSALSSIQHIHRHGRDGLPTNESQPNFLYQSFDIDVVMNKMNQVFDSAVAMTKSAANDDGPGNGCGDCTRLQQLKTKGRSLLFLRKRGWVETAVGDNWLEMY